MQDDNKEDKDLNNEQIKKLFDEKAKSILFTFEDEMLAIEKEIMEMKNSNKTSI